MTQSDTPIADAPPRADVTSPPVKTAPAGPDKAAPAGPDKAAPAGPVEPAIAVPVLATKPSQAPAADDLVEADLLVEDVSIDGMCGVY